jgi:hypothetical protein
LHAKEILDHSVPPKTSLGLSFVKFFLEGDRGFVRSRTFQKSSS